MSGFWRYMYPRPKDMCLDEVSITFPAACVKVVVDFIVTTLPIPLVMKLKMTRRQRFGSVLLLGCGYLITAASSVRTYYTHRVYVTGDTWDFYTVFLAGSIENHIAVVCCFPCVRRNGTDESRSVLVCQLRDLFLK